jgi:hypothetical protein
MLNLDLETLLASARVSTPLPWELRARALARARAFVRAASVLPAGFPTRPAQSWGRLALAVSIVVAAMAMGVGIGAVLALHDQALGAEGIAGSVSCCRTP